MFKSFKISIDDIDSEISKMPITLNTTLANVGNEALEKLKGYLVESKKLDGSQIQADWFPEINANIFISHSHSDEKKAIQLSNWLYETFGLRSFIDSSIWGHSEALLRKIDDQFCHNKDKTFYIYELRNQSTSHVHMMLSNALVKMMDKCECIFFLNTPNSVTSKDIIEKTHSPWIFHEISTVHTLRTINPREVIHENRTVFSKSASQYVPIEYQLDFENFTCLDSVKLKAWKSEFNSLLHQKIHPLDVLYKKFL